MLKIIKGRYCRVFSLVKLSTCSTVMNGIWSSRHQTILPPRNRYLNTYRKDKSIKRILSLYNEIQGGKIQVTTLTNFYKKGCLVLNKWHLSSNAIKPY